MESDETSKSVHLFDAGEMAAAYREQFKDTLPTVISRADRILGGEIQYFFHNWQKTGFPPNWHKNPFTGESAPTECHWSELGDFGFGDIKVIWEASRFSFAYDLTRAYLATNNEKYAEGFWAALEDWRKNNPPQLGVNWKCGQEISIRLMAWVFALNGLQEAKSSTAERLKSLIEMIAASARRVEANLDYALSQKSNHGHSEGVGLFTVGSLFPGLPEASGWRKKGLKLINSLTEELIYEDGFCCMYSFNYLRCMLDVLIWANWVSEASGDEFAPVVVERMQCSMNLLLQAMDGEGRLPNYGSNDGSLNLPLTTCDFNDYRPVVQAISVIGNEKVLQDGPWDELSFWITNGNAAKVHQKIPTQDDLYSKPTGIGILRNGDSFAMMRAGKTLHRATHSDMLACHITWQGIPIAIDAGTYSYNAPPPLNRGFAGSAFHNSLCLDERDQMESITRFIKYPRVHGYSSGTLRSAKGNLAVLVGSHTAFNNLPGKVRYSRILIHIMEDFFLVIDRASSSNEYLFSLNWLLCSNNGTLEDNVFKMETAKGDYYVSVTSDAEGLSQKLVNGDQQTGLGFSSEHYGSLEHRDCLLSSVRSSTINFYSCFGPEPLYLRFGGESFHAACGSFILQGKLTSNNELLLVLSDSDNINKIDELTTQLDAIE
ncbi:hypothetical protein G0Q06_11235 [Puniceicoccales bacterium CK1056]|uniref:Uncharacterized protein n=1 Tax=Oceanipulchritudo coccoides TaxID=2706888 RepID=A0A6B2M4M1_9BACT|nr:heparinase II/III family protein [Oceanipulchritudo coccoides]NDV63027.1 hypothetical protein [Oceanipulchritudo coccoides]